MYPKSALSTMCAMFIESEWVCWSNRYEQVQCRTVCKCLQCLLCLQCLYGLIGSPSIKRTHTLSLLSMYVVSAMSTSFVCV